MSINLTHKEGNAVNDIIMIRWLFSTFVVGTQYFLAVFVEITK